MLVHRSRKVLRRVLSLVVLAAVLPLAQCAYTPEPTPTVPVSSAPDTSPAIQQPREPSPEPTSDLDAASLFEPAASAQLNGPGLQRVTLTKLDLPADTQYPTLIGDDTPMQITMLGDVNGDGVLDILEFHSNTYFLTEGTIRFFINHGNGSFKTPVSLAEDLEYQKLGFGELNNDGKLDIAYSKDNSISVLIGEGDGSFKLEDDIFTEKDLEIKSINLADINNDSLTDIILWGPNKVLLGKGDATFGTAIPLTTNKTIPEEVENIKVTDVNNDRNTDIIVSSYGTPLTILIGEGNMGLHPVYVDEKALYTGENYDIGDINNDGIVDIVVGSKSIKSTENASTAKIWIGTGDGAFHTSLDLPNVQANLKVHLADFDGDSILDLATMDTSQGSSIYFGQGDGYFANPITMAPPDQHYSDMKVGDLNNDGTNDIVFSNPKGSYVLLNMEHNRFEGPSVVTSLNNVSPILLADANNDSTLDIVFDTGFALTSEGSFSIADAENNLPTPNSKIILHDINNDGVKDIFSLIRERQEAKTINLSLSSHNGDLIKFQTHSIDTEEPASFSLGDINGDSEADIIAGNDSGEIQILVGRGGGAFDRPKKIASTCDISDIGAGDLNSDILADVVVVCRLRSQFTITSKGDGNFETTQTKHPLDSAYIELEDINSDGILDIILAKERITTEIDRDYIAIGKGDGDFANYTPLPGAGVGNYNTILQSGDLNLDGSADIIIANGNAIRVFFNRSDGSFNDPVIFSTNRDVIDLEIGDIDSDGIPDIIFEAFDTFENKGEIQLLRGLRNKRFIQEKVAPNTLPAAVPTPAQAVGARPRAQVSGASMLTDTGLTVQVLRPRSSSGAPALQNAPVSDAPVIDIPYRLSDPEGRPARTIQGFYSLDGGGTWRSAVSADNNRHDLAADRAGSDHVFRWDISAHNLTGQYPQVIFRIIAFPYLHDLPETAGGARPPSNVSPSFHLRGTQVRVVDPKGQGAANARVYRLPDKQITEGQLIPAPANGNSQWYTDPSGYLKGHEPLALADRLVALAPISATTTYTLYHTSARPTPDGLALRPIALPGVQTLTVTQQLPLVLFNLDLSVEWDARSDTGFRTQLDKQIKRASELLFRWSGGQAALGDIHVFNNSQNWNTAHIRLYATNRMRPSATQGGIVEDRRPDPTNPELVYEPGQLRMGAVWNRYGEASAELGEEWARTLAHELGHYALFLNDNYLVKRDGRLITSGECPGPMTDPYDDSEGSFRPQAGWLPTCASTLSQLENNRDDWTTITAFYTADTFALNEPSAFMPENNPGLLPLAVTQVRFDADFTTSDDLPVAGALVLLADSAGKPLRLGSRARGMLYQDGLMVDLGSPVEDRLVARGARRGDTVCVYAVDPVKSRQRHGCVTLTSSNQQLRLSDANSWQPDVRLSPVTSATLRLEVGAAGLALGETLKAQLYTTEKNVLPEISLGRVGDTEVYTATLDTIEGTALEGLLRVWSTGMTRREVVVDLRVDGNPGAMWSRGVGRDSPGAMWSRGVGRTSPGAMWSRGVGRTSPGAMWSRGAPLLSVDGQAILYTSQTKLDPGVMYLLQATDGAPAPPAWATPVSRAYRLSATPGASLAGSSLNINYLSQDVPFGQEQGVRLFAWDAGARQWRLQDTYLDQERNEASAVVSEEGLYMLMTATEALRGGQGWNLNAFYPGVAQPVAQATATISGSYSLIAGFEPGQSDPWRIYDPALPAAWAPLVNDLTLLRAGERYWLHATAPISWFVRGPDKQRDQQSPATPAAPATARSLPPSLPAGAPSGQAGQRLILGSLPPAVFYGLAPAEGLAVEALVDGQLCDSTTTSLQTLDGVQRAVFVIKVRALGDGNTYCGVSGRAVRLVFGDGTQRDVSWDNTRTQLVDADAPSTP